MEEVMRLYPPAFWFTRSAVEDDVIGGYHIKAGQMMAVVPYAIHRHPDFWDNPEEFDPERFEGEHNKGRHSLAFMPFGAGQRQCIGKDFALMEGALILSQLAQRYTFIDVPERQPVAAFGPTLATKDGMWLKIAKR
jgi:cytochrome P450